MPELDGAVVSMTRWREVTVYPLTPAPADPDSDEPTVTGWPVIALLLVLLPPLGWLQLSRRRDVPRSACVLLAVVSLVTVVAAWQTAFQLLNL